MTELSFRQCFILTKGKFYKVQLRKIIRDSTASTDEVITVYLSVMLNMLRQLDPSIRGRRKNQSAKITVYLSVMIYMLRQLDSSIRGRRRISRRKLAEVYYSLVNFIIREYQSFQKILFIFEKSYVMSRIG